MLFPDFQNKRSAIVDLNEQAKQWLMHHHKASTNPLLNPSVCQNFVDDVHQRLGVNFSYGGWMEDRSTLWRGSYLDEDQRYIHLGVDFNVPAGTRVAVDRAYNVLRIDNDYPDKYGWGTRVIIQEPDANFVTIFAHLAPSLDIKVSDQLKAGTIFAEVGHPPYNGDWFPHLHVQLVEIAYYYELLKDDLRDLDGYGHAKDVELLKQRFPNPVTFLQV